MTEYQQDLRLCTFCEMLTPDGMQLVYVEDIQDGWGGYRNATIFNVHEMARQCVTLTTTIRPVEYTQFMDIPQTLAEYPAGAEVVIFEQSSMTVYEAVLTGDEMFGLHQVFDGKRYEWIVLEEIIHVTGRVVDIAELAEGQAA